MPVGYTEHATSRMRHRAISETDVEETLKEPDLSFTTRLGRAAALRKFGRRYLKVIYEKSNSKILVITVYWTRRPQRP